MTAQDRRLIIWFDDLRSSDVFLVGGKSANLGEMMANTKVPVPPGFSITAYAYRYFLEHNNLELLIRKALINLDMSDVSALRRAGDTIRGAIINASIPPDLIKAIKDAYTKLGVRLNNPNPGVAIRSSATAEDLPDASFAGQQDTFLNITGIDQVLAATRRCFASLFTDRAISYRQDKQFDHFDVAISVAVQQMARSDLAAAGVAFSIDTETGFSNVVYITGSYGLGEYVVQGIVNPDQWYVFKPTGKIIHRKLGNKDKKLVYKASGGTVPATVPSKQRRKFVLSNEQVEQLAQYVIQLEHHYQTPVDVEWALDGITNQLYIVQVRPETVQATKDKTKLRTYKLDKKSRILIEGEAVGRKISAGKTKILYGAHELHKFQPGYVLVTDMTDPDWEPIMKQASAIITNKGGRTCFSKDTLILTDIGFLSIQDVYYLVTQGRRLYTVALNPGTLRMEWKQITDAMQRLSETIEISVSQSGQDRQNTLRLTPDHKCMIIKRRQVNYMEISLILKTNHSLTIANKIPSLISKADGLYPVFTCSCRMGASNIRSVSYKQIKTNKYSETFVQDVVSSRHLISKRQLPFKLTADPLTHAAKYLTDLIGLNNLFHSNSNKLTLSIHDTNKLQNVVIASLLLGIPYTVSLSDEGYHITWPDKYDVMAPCLEKSIDQNTVKARNHLFTSKGLFADIDQLHHFAGIKIDIEEDEFLEDEKIRSLIIPCVSLKVQRELDIILNSHVHSQRVMQTSGSRGQEPVYNITVADHHNYLVFTKNYVPLVVANCHAAIVSRELGITCVIGTENATDVLIDNQPVTIDCSQGIGRVYDGILPFHVQEVDLKTIPETKTQIMMNIGIPEKAFDLCQYPHDGVGLARLEFIINSHIQIHPLSLIQYTHLCMILEDEEALEDLAHKHNLAYGQAYNRLRRTLQQIDELTQGYQNKAEYFVEKLAYGIATIAAAFYPKPAIFRTSDFKTSEYRNLVGGWLYEPDEHNAMIGYRGCSRYYSKQFQPAFRLECQAFKRVRDEMGLWNTAIMYPFCRTIAEADKVTKILSDEGLIRHHFNGKHDSAKGLQIYCMAEIPSNIFLADKFADRFDGFSIGSNDLTQLILGIDRDSELLAHLFDERDEAITRAMSHLIRTAHDRSPPVKVGICGQSPSDWESIRLFLVKEGIDSMSLNPDTLIQARLDVAKIEQLSETEKDQRCRQAFKNGK
ncbi:MAG: PEP/pyruvate-binding domain-containing protein [Candidatus Ranarchaeia archaeon]